MARGRAWCAPNRHQWMMTATILTAPPLPGGTPAFLIRACLVCPLAEVIHALEVEGGVIVAAVEHWDTRPQAPGVTDCRVVHDRWQEQGAWGIRAC